MSAPVPADRERPAKQRTLPKKLTSDTVYELSYRLGTATSALARRRASRKKTLMKAERQHCNPL